jgi:putative Mg2+ transporter-C (MgtC) family protein
MHTHMLVSVGAALFCLTGTQVNADHKEYLRIIQGVASGVGFVGAASVLREGMSVRGINMAASIWTTAAVGCEVGFGEHLMALVLAPIVAALNAAFYLLDSKLLEEPRREAEHKEQAKA